MTRDRYEYVILLACLALGFIAPIYVEAANDDEYFRGSEDRH